MIIEPNIILTYLCKLYSMPCICVSLTEQEKTFIKENQLSPTKIFKAALKQKGFKE